MGNFHQVQWAGHYLVRPFSSLLPTLLPIFPPSLKRGWKGKIKLINLLLQRWCNLPPKGILIYHISGMDIYFERIWWDGQLWYQQTQILTISSFNKKDNCSRAGTQIHSQRSLDNRMWVHYMGLCTSTLRTWC